MAMEISFCVCGKETKQALFIEESELEAPLSKIRKTVEKQELHVPLEYKFITKKGNAISHPSEENILLRDIIQSANKDWTQNDVKLEEQECQKGEDDSEKVEKELPNNGQLWITPLKVVSINPLNENMLTENDQNETGADGTNNGRSNTRGSHCIYIQMKRYLLKPDGSLDVMKITKLVAPLTILLFILLGAMTLSMHILVKTVITSGPPIADMLSKLNDGMEGGRGGVPLETLNDYQVRLSKLEVSHKFEVKQLTNRITELEDLFLNDFDDFKQELTAIKKTMAEKGMGHNFVDEEQTVVTDINKDSAIDKGKMKYTSAKPSGDA